MKEFPDNEIQTLSRQLLNHHHQLFGEMRKFEQDQLSDFWIKHMLPNFGNLTLGYFYSAINALKTSITENKNEKALKASREHVLSFLKDKDKEYSFSHNEVKIGAEYWRENIAVFRSSLN